MLSHRAVWANCVRGRTRGGRWPRSSQTKSPQLCHKNTNPDVRWVSSGVDRRQLHATQEEVPAQKPLPPQAQVVIAGGGAIGCSVAYHLAKFGWTDVVLLEQGRLSCGTTWHAAGCCAMLVEGILREMFEYSKQLYPTLEAETGVNTGWQQTGSIYVARTEDRMTAYRRHADAIRAMGVECDLVSPRDVSVYHPLLRVDDLKGALWVPGDGVATAADVTQALAKGATMKGVQIHEKVGVEKVLTSDGRVSGVRTNKGDIRCDNFVNCTGQYDLDGVYSHSCQIPMLSHRAVWANCVRGRTRGGRWPRSSQTKSPQLCHKNTNPDVRWVSSGVDRRQLHATQEEVPAQKPLPPQAQVVIAGGGAIGCSVAYHLAKFGWTDVVLLEQGRLSCGTTWHAAGCCAMLVEGILREMFEYSKQLYPTLEAETNVNTGWQQTGSIYVARTEDRMTAYRRHADAIRAMGVECDLVSPRDVSVYHPLLRVDDLKGALWVPGDGVATAADVTQALAKGATMKGVQIHEKVGVEKVLTSDGRVSGVRTNKGDIRCDNFVNCTGQWAWELGQQSSPSVRVPLHSCEHFYIITDPVAGANITTPVAQDPDGYNYLREWNGGFICGGFEPKPKPVFTDGIPSPFEFQLLEEDWDHFQPVLEQILLRMPALKEVKVKKFLNGPESFTPDLFPNMGQAPEVPGYFVAAGMNSGGIASAGGVGKVMAEWIISGDPPAGTWPVDIRRFGEMHNNRRYLRERVKEILPMPYAQPYPKPEFQSARKMRMSPLYTTLEKAGAVFGVKMGYERANWFSKPESDDFMDVPSGWQAGQGTFGKPPWFDAVREEYLACQMNYVCLFQWAWELGQQSSPSVRVPLHSCEHFYIITDPVAGANITTPVAQDPDGYNYLREWNGGFICGGFEPKPKPVFTDGIPSPFEFQLLEEDWDHFQPVLEQILLRMPALKEVKVKKFLNGPESFTPDLFPNMGQAPELPGYFVAAGMNSGGIASAGGVGKVMAEWIISGDPPAGTWPVDIRRFGEMHNNRRYLRERVKEILPMPYAQPYPKPEFQSARKMRMSPLYTTLEKAGAVFGVKMGYERANWFSKPESDDFMDVPSGWQAGQGTFGKPPWFDAVREEYLACRQNVAVMDMSSFTKLEVRSAGDEVVTYLQRLCCNEVDVPVGTVLHTGMLNHYGGYENDCSLARLAENMYLIISPSNQMVRSWEWLHRHLPKEGTVQIRDITPYYAAINVLGPRSRELMAELTDTVTMSSQYFPSFTCRELSIGFAPRIRAMSLSHSGELGWMLYVPQEYALHVYDHIMHKGRDFGIRNVGYYTIAHLRMERAFAFWGIDLDASVTPFECQREHRVKFGKGVDFIGRSALLKQKQEGVRQKFVMFLLDNHDLENDLWPWGGEPIWEGGRVVGRTTSAGYGYTLKKQVCLGFVRNPDPQTGERQVITTNFITKSKFEIQIAGKKFSAAARLFPPQM
ncbi:PREDICTED: pyruvate dehydrogenase phosphatase regulatory subunit, mitochondrial-like [Branchiostoma belcheri]|uniref:Pyruvate dehydrogenase phosphatase regulatory subunit, mitochondrial-like n=1 Tax=Branchiostoma belcheri TaxID=7741 RepID=A0A6P4ZGG4_BRABE|nr:PREDICTED: pyruvate dehydrogenase phosphatase regulatory subunit, mitochondrial-like [Branchiostoma belcheri]